MNKDVSYYHNKLKEYLSNFNIYKKVHESEWAVRCPFCGDSTKNAKHTHMYIGFKDTGHVLYYCQRCPAHSRMTPDALEKFGIFDQELNEFFGKKIKVNSNILKMMKSNNTVKTPIYSIPKSNKQENQQKIEYFEKRTKVKVTNEAIETYSIILNLNDFLEENNINISKYDKEKQYCIKELSKNFIGFLSSNKSIITLRAIGNTSFNKTKFNFVIDESYRKPFQYIIKVPVDLLTVEPNIILAEGTFDIINIRNTFYPSDSTDTVFASVGGKSGYRRVIQDLISTTGFLNAKISIFSDKDVELDSYAKNVLGPYYGILKTEVYYNELAKDYGEIEAGFKLRKFRI